MKVLNIGRREVGSGKPCFLVAEIGINFNGDLKLAKEIIKAAAGAGAEAVKFQNYRTEDFIPDCKLSYEYISQGKKIVESQYEMFKRCELKKEWLFELKTYCDQMGVIFHSTPTNEEGIRDLLEVGTPVLKNGSDYLTHLELITAMGRTGLPTVISTGMANLREIEEAVTAFRSTGNERIILLHCTSSYPTTAEEVNLRRIPILAKAFDCPVGFSDHTEGLVAGIGAVVLGACWIEKHFTLDKNLPGPDHRFSADPAEFKELAKSVRLIEKNLGTSSFKCTLSEGKSRQNYRLSCAAKRDLPAGHKLGAEDIAYMRPGTGFPPKNKAFLTGRRLSRQVPAGRVFTQEDFQ